MKIATRIAHAMLASAPLAACSQETGVPQVDRARDALASEIRPGPQLRRVGAAADAAARGAVAAGESGRPDRMAGAVGRGVRDVACAGVGARGEATGALAREATRTGLASPTAERAAEAVRGAAASLPDMPSPCG